MNTPQSKDLRAFPVHSMYAGKNGCPSFVRWEALSEEWASKNHDQTLTRLAERGGLDPTEIVANLERRAYHDRPLSVATAIKLIEPYACENPRVEAKSSNLEVAQLLTDCACILDVVKGEWAESWSEWDQGVRDRITAYLRRFHDTAQGSLVGIEPHCIERVWCKLKSGHPGPCSAAAPESRDG